MSFLEDLGNFGSGMLDDVGEGFGSIIKTATTSDHSKNAATTQQPQQPIKDNNGNAVTGSHRSQDNDKTLLYVGGGVGVALLLTVIVVVATR
ncbi:hypothetical protein BCU33_009640 [Vibrio lentus]|uniref:hypothetical protein n=1 Tax=Vibrio TaxID=662 RepID=UPI000C85B983|nr:MULTISPECIES: hypothetical protein [Vibrio]PMI95240.1 hypothetical protein BCU33_11085 [Vibrio lentus]CAK2965037.1 conserved hypothetical protein [Vibrio crassostreae]